MSGDWGQTIFGWNRNQSSNGLVVVCEYDRVGVYRETNEPVGCKVTATNFVKVNESHLNATSATYVGFGYKGRFDSYTDALFLWNIESADVEYEFFFTERKEEKISLMGSVISLTSLDSHTTWDGQHHEGCQLPNNVRNIYKTNDSIVTIDATLRGRQSYAHCCFGNGPYGYANEDAIYDASNRTKHGFMWECPEENVRFKAIDPAGYFGFNVLFSSLTISAPDDPVKNYSIER